jgi:AcrR family transcriptional regulator
VATRQKLLDAARSVFAVKGLDLPRIDEITDRADVGKGTFYSYFKNRDHIIRELIRNVLAELEMTMEAKCAGVTEVSELLDALIAAHVEFFNNRWEDFVLYYQGRTELTIEDGYSGIETPFVEYLERIEALLSAVLKRHLPHAILRKIACATAGFVSGYYSFAAIASPDEDIDEMFRSLRGAMVASLTRFIKEATSSETPN